MNKRKVNVVQEGKLWHIEDAATGERFCSTCRRFEENYAAVGFCTREELREAARAYASIEQLVGACH